MGKLVRMDLYRMRKARSFFVCLIIAFAIALINAPLAKMLFSVANEVAPDLGETLDAQVKLSEVINDPFPMIILLPLLLSLCFFFYADVENGYIKNIAGQMPMKGFTILSKFLAAAVHNLIFAAAGLIGNLIGTVLVQRIVVDSNVPDGIRVLVLKFLLVQSISAILLFVVSTLRNKAVGMILAVLFGLGLTSLIYFGINQAMSAVLGQGSDISIYMPDTLLDTKPLDTKKALAVSLVTGGVFLLAAVRIFDRRDVK